MPYRYETTLTFEGVEYDVQVSYGVDFGQPATRLDPASDDEVHSIRLEKVGGKAAPWGFHEWSDRHFAQLVEERLEASIDTLGEMIVAAHEQEAGDYDAYQEAKWEERRAAA